MAILLTGGGGFIGSHLAERLLDSGREVVVLDNFDPYYSPAIKRNNLIDVAHREGFQLVEGDIRDADLLEKLSTRYAFDTIVHLAARAGVRASLENPALAVEVNVTGTTRLLELARRKKISRFIFASSSSVYGERAEIPFREEESLQHPESPYAATKAAGELMAWTYHKLFGIQTTCLRFFTVYGPRQRPEMAIHYFTRLMEEGQEVPVFGDGSSRRDYTYVDDIVAGVMEAAVSAEGFRVYNLGNSSPIQLRELLDLISRTLKKPARIKSLPVQQGDVTITCANIERAQKELNYNPQTPIETGIRKFVEWYRLKRGGGSNIGGGGGK